MKAIPDFPGYFITKTGKVLSQRTNKSRYSKWLKLEPSGHNHNYFSVRLCKDGKVYGKQVHRLVLETFVGKCPKGLQCRHLNGNPQDNRLENLCWGTAKENQEDAIKHGKQFAKGEMAGRTKLSEKIIRSIIYMWRTRLFTQKEIAEAYRVSQPNIAAIVNKKSWKHLWRN